MGEKVGKNKRDSRIDMRPVAEVKSIRKRYKMRLENWAGARTRFERPR